MRWEVVRTDVKVDEMAQALNITPLTSRALANKGIRTRSAVRSFLNPTAEQYHDAATMADMDKAIRVLSRARAKNVKTVVFGDYDADGVTSVTIVYKTLVKFGFDVSYYVPKRDEEGYGLTMAAVEKLCGLGAKLIVTCDNGIAAAAEVKRAKELGAAVVVFDHHEPPFADNGGERVDILPEAAAVVNPKRKDCPYPFKHLCAAGVAFKFAEYLHKTANADFGERDEFLALAAIATHCDVVELVDENRLLARDGQAAINGGRHGNVGLAALIGERGLSGKTIGDFEIGFIIGPCVNASGRVAHAKTAVELFTTDDRDEAVRLAKELVELNNERKSLTAKAAEAALALAQSEEYRGDKVLTLLVPDAHESVAGIAAGRVREAVNRPAVVFTRSGDGLIKGSARSIEKYNIFEGLYEAKHLFTRFGGHAMAAGLTMPEDNLPELRNILNSRCILSDADFEPIIKIDGEADFDDITFDQARELELLAPFGKGNPRPVFACYGALAEQADLMGADKKTVRLGFRDSAGRVVKGIAFGKADLFADILRGSGFGEKMVAAFKSGELRKLPVKIDVAFTVELNEYNGTVSEQLRVVDMKKAANSIKGE